MNSMGSPVAARQNPGNYKIILIALVILLVLFLVYLIVKWIENLHSSPQWLEMHKNQETTKKNIVNIAKLSGLTKDEKNLLEDICRNFHAPNIEYLVREEKAIDTLFRNAYRKMIQEKESEDRKSCFFTLRYKLERARTNSLIITSTKSILAGSEFHYVDERGSTWVFTLNENNPQGLVIAIPQTFANSNFKPPQMAKLNLTYVSKTGIAYIVSIRVIRYEQSKENIPLIFASHSNTLKALQRRNSKRMLVNKRCSFSAVNAKADSSTGKIIYEKKEKNHDGNLEDISASGCKILCSLPIQQGQYIYVDFTLDDRLHNSATGIIVKTIQTEDENHFILHIKFVQIALRVRNLIDSVIYNYADIENMQQTIQ